MLKIRLDFWKDSLKRQPCSLLIWMQKERYTEERRSQTGDHWTPDAIGRVEVSFFLPPMR